MDVDLNLLTRFEEQLIPHKLSKSQISVKIIGYGEISSILEIDGNSDIVYKRLPIFTSIERAESYRGLYCEYCRVLKEAGIRLPEDATAVIQIPGRPAVLYFLQTKMPAETFCHSLIHTLEKQDLVRVVEAIVDKLKKVWDFNRKNSPILETAIDAQLSNWCWIGEKGQETLSLVDTSTPFLRKNNCESLDVEVFLSSMPGMIRWAVRRMNMEDVIGRYYNKHKVLVDIIGNLYKEQRPDLIPLFLEVVNRKIDDETEPLKKEEVDSYYKDDKMIWTLLSGLRRVDRFFTTTVLRKRYEFILPGNVKR